MSRLHPRGLKPSDDNGDILTTVGGVATWAPASGGAETLDDLTDVDTTTTPPVIGDSLVWNGTEWAPGRGTHAEIVMETGTSSPPIPVETPDGTDWVYAEVIG